VSGHILLWGFISVLPVVTSLHFQQEAWLGAPFLYLKEGLSQGWKQTISKASISCVLWKTLNLREWGGCLHLVKSEGPLSTPRQDGLLIPPRVECLGWPIDGPSKVSIQL
jgi:hypothetical protein